jgi:hypothetical protein
LVENGAKHPIETLKVDGNGELLQVANELWITPTHSAYLSHLTPFFGLIELWMCHRSCGRWIGCARRRNSRPGLKKNRDEPISLFLLEC